MRASLLGANHVGRNIESISDWKDLRLEHLFYAYRKAKADSFFERSSFDCRAFAVFEVELPSRLAGLLDRLQQGDVASILRENLGTPQIAAKKLGVRQKEPTVSNGHGYFSKPGREFQRLLASQTLTPEFRVVGDFPVEMHVLSALWINLIAITLTLRCPSRRWEHVCADIVRQADSAMGSITLIQ